MIKIDIKPLSVNEAYKGIKIRTEKYNVYAKNVHYLLPQKYDLPQPPFLIHLEFGLSSSFADWDNPIKPFQDVLAKKYNFNDKLIKKGIVTAVNVEKGKEYIKFKIEHFNQEL
jgi:Holliday junction resolvase RusA-like endonuclease